MNTHATRIPPASPRRVSPALVLGLATAIASLGASSAFAQATWVGDTDNDWNTAANWSSDPSNPSGNFTINTATGNYPVLSANSAFTPTDVLIGSATGQSGRFDHTAGAVSLAVVGANGNWFKVGQSGGAGAYNLADTSLTGQSGLTTFGQGTGSLTVGKFFVGGAYFAANGAGTVNINTSGTLSAQSTQSFTDGSANQNASIVVGRGATGSGTLNLENGTVNSAGQFWVGSLGAGVVNQTGGTVNVGSNLLLARNNNNTQAGDGTWNVSGAGTVNIEGDLVLAYAGNADSQGAMNIGAGGSVNVATTTKRWLIVNQWDSTQGALNISGGTLNLNANTDIRFSTGNGSVGTSGGTGASVVTLSGGAITSYSGNGTGATTTAVVDLNRAGASVNNTFNLDGGTLTISQVMTTNDTGTATFNFNGGTLKASNTGANFIDLGGAGQTAVVKAGGAVIDSNGFDVTVPQALLAGDGAGGLAKNGLGTLTLSGANTYVGDSTVNAGGLTIGSTGSMLFAVTDADSTQVLVLGTSSFTFDGTMKLDLGGVTVGSGSWLLIDADALATSSFGSSFAVQDNGGLLAFTKNGSVWTSDDDLWAFSEETGVLTLGAIPEPAGAAALLGAFALGAVALRRRRG